MPELRKAQALVGRAIQYLDPVTSPQHSVRDDVRAQLPALRDRLQHIGVDLGLLIELQVYGGQHG